MNPAVIPITQEALLEKRSSPYGLLHVLMVPNNGALLGREQEVRTCAHHIRSRQQQLAKVR